MPTPYQRLVAAVSAAIQRPATDLIALIGHHQALAEPAAVTDALAAVMPARFSLTGTHESRLLFVEHPATAGWTVADLSGQPLGQRTWPEWTTDRVTIADPTSWLSDATVTSEGVRRLLQPNILLTALYHKENFPLPRFPLAISDSARAARTTLSGRVRLMDMQLGFSLEDILAAVESQQPDIVGVSATFGQHDLMIELLEQLFAMPTPPLVLAGGSLTARNEKLLLDRYPRLLIARGAGEPTIVDTIAYFHDDLPLADVRGIGYTGTARGVGMAIGTTVRRNATLSNRQQTDILPELDLLGATFAHHGVAQLETSRGCTNYCSFCPRGHKGIWSGSGPDGLPWILDAMGEVFDQYPSVSRVLYLVDEEFIGRGPDVVQRALSVASTLHNAGFRWESSCRVDQVVMPTQNRDWHYERAAMWRQLVEHGLRRMLFGVESGVDSILARFNKETTGEQNALAIRTLTALGVPPRFTYITFDHLMDLGELKATHAFQARTDLLLKPLPHLSVQEIVDGVRDEDFVARHSLHRPFYNAISYLMVSMECLIGAAYTKEVEKACLTGQMRPSMGRVDAAFADWRIGRASHHSQLWVDRNFALDYTLKSLEKILEGEPYWAVRRARVVIKQGAFAMLSRTLDLITGHRLDQPDDGALDAALLNAMDAELRQLADAMADTVAQTSPELPAASARLLTEEYHRWTTAAGWQLINAGDSCGN